MSLNLEKQLRFVSLLGFIFAISAGTALTCYGAYHHNPVNVRIHMTCVLPILLSFILLFTNTPTLLPPSSYTKNPILSALPPNFALLVCLAYCTLYVLLEPVAGTALAAFLLAFTIYANDLTIRYSPVVNYYAIGINIASWIAQFLGHGVFEGRAPALFDNLYQALFLAPLFVWLEFWFVLGYRADLKSRLDKYVEEDIKKFHDAKKVNGNSNGHSKSG